MNLSADFIELNSIDRACAGTSVDTSLVLWSVRVVALGPSHDNGHALVLPKTGHVTTSITKALRGTPRNHALRNNIGGRT